MNFLVVLLMLIPTPLLAQNFIEDNFPNENGVIVYSEVVKVDSALTSKYLYLNAKKWLVSAFKSSRAVIETDEKDDGLIILKGFVLKGHNQEIRNPKKWFTIKLEFKDGRYKYSLSNIRYEFDVQVMGVDLHRDVPFEEWINSSTGSTSPEKRQKLNDKLNEYCRELDAEFRAIIIKLKSEIGKKEGEW